MEERVGRLTVLKKYMTMADMMSYFEYQSPKSIYELEKRGLKPIIVSAKRRIYKDTDIIEFFDKLRGE